jgi:hypothetical protein
MEKQNELKVEPERVEKFIELADMIEKLQDELVLPHNFFKTIAQKIREIIPPLYESWQEYERKIADGELVRKEWHDEQVLHANHLGEFEKIKQQAVKDTAKEIADWLITTESDKEDLAKIIKEHYGVEVE